MRPGEAEAVVAGAHGDLLGVRGGGAVAARCEILDTDEQGGRGDFGMVEAEAGGAAVATIRPAAGRIFEQTA